MTEWHRDPFRGETIMVMPCGCSLRMSDEALAKLSGSIEVAIFDAARAHQRDCKNSTVGMMPGQKAYTLEERVRLHKLLEGACEADEKLTQEELEGQQTSPAAKRT